MMDDDKQSGNQVDNRVDHEYKDYATEAALLESHQRPTRPDDDPSSQDPFPIVLYCMLEKLEREGLSNIASWAPHGRAFVVHNRELFVQEVLPKYFSQTQYTSFQRQLSLYGFKRLTRGPDQGGYYNPKFLRISRTFARNIRRTKIKNDGPRKSAAPDLEPDLYSLPKLTSSIPNARGGLTGRPRAASVELQQFMAASSPVARLSGSLPSASLGPPVLPSSLGLRGLTSPGSLGSSPAFGQDFYRNRLIAQNLSQNVSQGISNSFTSQLQPSMPHLPQLEQLNTQQRLLQGLRLQQQQQQQQQQAQLHIQDQNMQGTLFGASTGLTDRSSLSLSAAFPQDLSSFLSAGNYDLSSSPFDPNGVLHRGSLTLPPNYAQSTHHPQVPLQQQQHPIMQHQRSQLLHQPDASGVQLTQQQLLQVQQLQAAEHQRGGQESDASASSSERMLLEVLQRQRRDANQANQGSPANYRDCPNM